MRALLCSFSRVVLPACLTLAPFLVQAQERWPVATRPTLDIFGELSPDGAVLAMPIAATLTSSGHLIVIDALENHLLVLDRAGRFVHRLGREGGGPGEFRGISWSGHCGSDSVAVWDRRGGRLVYVDGEGKLLGQVPVPFSPPVAGRTASTACSRTGTFALLSLPEVTPQGAIVRGPATLTLYDAEAGERPFPASVTSSEFVIMRGGGSPRPLGRQTHVALDDRHVFVGTADSAHVSVYTLEGRLMGGIRTPYAPRPVTKAEYDAAVEEVTSAIPHEVRGQVSELLLAQPIPEQTAAYHGLHLDPTGALWVRTSPSIEPYTRFSIHDRSGRELGTLELPRSLTVFEIGHDYVLGFYVADDGEPHLTMYAFTRPAAAP